MILLPYRNPYPLPEIKLEMFWPNVSKYVRAKGEAWHKGRFGEYYLPLYRQPFIAKPGKPPTNKNLYCYKAGRSISRNGFFIYLRVES